MVMRCWLLQAGSSLESMTVLGVTPLALWGSAQVLMVLTSSSMVNLRMANIFPAQQATRHSVSVHVRGQAGGWYTGPFYFRRRKLVSDWASSSLQSCLCATQHPQRQDCSHHILGSNLHKVLPAAPVACPPSAFAPLDHQTVRVWSRRRTPGN
jgi:hypothetical protein